MDFKFLYFSFDGRINRAKFWGGYVLLLAIVLVVAAVDILVLTGGILAMLTYLGILIPVIALSVKRCHDRNRTGWFFLVSLVPIVSLWYLVEVGFLPGTPGPNQYGADPLGAVGMATTAG